MSLQEIRDYLNRYCGAGGSCSGATGTAGDPGATGPTGPGIIIEGLSTGQIIFNGPVGATGNMNLVFDPDANGGLGKLYVSGGIDPIYLQLTGTTSNPSP